MRGLEYCDGYVYGCGGLRCAGRNGGERERDCEWACEDACRGPSVAPDGGSIAAEGMVMGNWWTVAGGVGATIVVLECVCWCEYTRPCSICGEDGTELSAGSRDGPATGSSAQSPDALVRRIMMGASSPGERSGLLLRLRLLLWLLLLPDVSVEYKCDTWS